MGHSAVKCTDTHHTDVGTQELLREVQYAAVRLSVFRVLLYLCIISEYRECFGIA